jgi:hypothetical protein
MPGVTSRLGTIFFTLNVLGYPAISALDRIIEERPVVERELARSYYR